MKLKNKKTGEIGYLQNDTLVKRLRVVNINNDTVGEYNSLAELNEGWEDYKEPKEYWYINEFGTPAKAYFVGRETLYDKCRKNFGNYFSSQEEAELAVRKLKAWKRLKDKGFKFCCDIKYESLCGNGFNIPLNAIMPPEAYTDIEVRKDLDLLFSDNSDEDIYVLSKGEDG